MPERVSIVSQRNYESAPLERSIERAIELSGFDLKSVCGKSVLLKPNMLGAYPPSMAVTTHPSFVAAVGRVLLRAGAKVAVGDSPNGVQPIARTWEITDMSATCTAIGAKEARFEAMGSVWRMGLKISRAVTDADIIVNLPKFKTHSLTVLTLAVKNLFGCVNGMEKTRHHRDYTGNEFADLLVRIADIVCPELTIIDGVVAMEGEGPSAGKPKDLGVIIAGQNVHAVDTACCMLIDLPPLELDTLSAAKRLGLWEDRDSPDLVGDPIEGLRPKTFSLPSTYTRGIRDWWIARFVVDRIWSGLSSQPVIDAGICNQCHLCIDGCPVGAISQAKPHDAPSINISKCTQCLCCHEICPSRAIYLKPSISMRLARWLSDMRAKRGEL